MPALPSRTRRQWSLLTHLWLALALVALAWPAPCAGGVAGDEGAEREGAPEQRGSIKNGDGGGVPGVEDEDEDDEEAEDGEEPGVSSVTRVGRIVARLGRFWHLFMAVLDCEAPPRAFRLAAVWP